MSMLSYYFAGGLIAFYIILVAVFYVFSALGLYTMAKRRGLENPWLAWIPIVYIYVIGKLADTYAAKHMNKKTNYAVLLLGLIVGVVVLVVVMLCTAFMGGFYMSYMSTIWPVFIILYVLVIAAAIVYAVFYYISLYRIYNWHSESATVLLILSILFSVIVPFVLFALRNGDNRYLYPPQQPGGGQPYAPQQPGQGYQQPPQQYYAPQQPQGQPPVQPQPPQDTPPNSGNAQ
ncbi:MAG: hypothetical protein VB081_04125 [Christensenella sp.]|uniref:hypothetical protein n=1 Tax=Christensenella sp. TaxID=1935934 RepID=UPI002B1F55CC|nr:hypothetical protein [Christensenella sp.]MEA5002666.1 hypothetical protein [Christensenella sp.]